MKKLLILLAAAVILIPLGKWWFSPEQVIRRKTEHLMEVLTLSSGTGGPMRQAKVFSMNAMLAPEVTLTIPDIADANGTFDKQEMESAFSWICQNAKKSEFRVTEFTDVAIDGDRAKVRFTAEGFLELGVGRPADGKFDVTIHWIKAGDGWRYDAVTWKNL
jgi:hypothetical protein